MLVADITDANTTQCKQIIDSKQASQPPETVLIEEQNFICWHNSKLTKIKLGAAKADREQGRKSHSNVYLDAELVHKLA